MLSLRDVVNYIPRGLQTSLRMIYHLPGEVLDRMNGQFNANIPPRRLRRVGPGDFEAIGNHMLDLFVTHGGLQANHRVLDMGCGVGRMAMPLTKFLKEDASYDGFDIMPDAIAWCQKHISTRHPNFTFEHIDVYNKSYNGRGKLKAQDVSFPYPDQQFDFVFATSLFTHLQAFDTAHYVAEMSRVMRSESHCFCTFFLLRPDAIRSIDAGESYLPFAHRITHGRTVNPKVPEQAIAFDEDFIRSLFAEHQLDIVEPIRFGQWANRTSALSTQDIIIAIKK